MVRMVAACLRANSDCTAFDGKLRRALRVFGSLIADAQAHQQFAEFETAR